jgi:DNA-binding MarR family transcriptional regulator
LPYAINLREVATVPVSTETTGELLRHVFQLARVAKSATGPEPVPGLRFGTLLVLSAVEHFGEVRGSDLADRLDLDVSVISRHLSCLEKEGLTGRKPDPRDGRAWLSRVTAKGAAALAEMRATRAQVFTEALADWDEQEARELVGRLERLEAVLHEAKHATTL